MQPPRRHNLKPTPEHLLLLGALAVFLGGAAWVAHGAGAGCPEATRLGLNGLPSIGLPLLYALFAR